MPSPVVTAIRNGTAPAPAKMAAARAALPLSPDDLLEILVVLSKDADPEIKSTAEKSLESFDQERMLQVVKQKTTPEDVLQYLCTWRPASRDIFEALILNDSTPDNGIADLAKWNRDVSILELVAINQERMIRCPAIIESLSGNSAASSEAKRRAREVQVEFFEKELGAKRIEAERKARAAAASAALGLNYVEEALVDMIDEDIPVEDLSLVSTLNSSDDPKIGPEFARALRDEVSRLDTESHPPAAASDGDAEQEAARIISEMSADGEETSEERLTWMQKIARMNVKARVQLALKGNREVRNILRRDSNKTVILGVLGNPRISEAEVENISAMKSLPEEALRLISLNRQWIRSYPVIHNLVRNARTPVATSLPLLNRLFPKDLKALGGNRNVPDVLRKQSTRLAAARKM